MEKINGNDSVYPIVEEKMQSQYGDIPNTLMEINSYGLTKREHFAAIAMQGLSANSSELQVSPPFILEFLNLDKEAYNYAKHYPMYVAKISVLYSDALIAELNK